MARHLIGAISIVGMALAVALLLAHTGSNTTSDGNGLLPLSLCGNNGVCDKVLDSRWAWFPPLPAEKEMEVARDLPLQSKTTEEALGVRLPVALLGLFYFTLVALWMWTRLTARFRFGRLLLVLCTMGALSSLALLVLMIQSVGAICPLCLASHLVNFCIFGLVLKGYVSRGRGASGTNSRFTSFAGLGKFATIAATVMLFQALLWQNLNLHKTNQVTTTALHELQCDVNAMEMIYLGQKRQNVSVRDDSTEGLDAIEFDAVLPASGTGYRNTIVVFGDVECGACRKFHDFLMNEVRPAHAGHVRVIFKHRPLDQIHPDARKAALALEAARRQGKFWELLDMLYARQGNLSGFDYGAAVRDLDMDLTSFVRDMSSPSAAQRIEQDEALANSLGVEGTPAVFLNNRRVDKSILRLQGFWSRQVESLKNTRTQAGQVWGASDAAAPARTVVLARTSHAAFCCDLLRPVLTALHWIFPSAVCSHSPAQKPACALSARASPRLATNLHEKYGLGR